MRDFVVIADRIIKVIQEKCTFDNKKTSEIIAEIEDVKRSHLYRAPEVYYMSWDCLSDILCDNFNPANSRWEGEIAVIFGDLKGTVDDYFTY